MKNLPTYISVMVFCLIASGVFAQESLLRLQYLRDEIFPIRIDKYGSPNIEIEFVKEPIWVIWDTGDMSGLVLSSRYVKSLSRTDSVRQLDSEGKFVGHSYRYTADSVRIFNQVLSNITVLSSSGDYNGLIGPRFVDLDRFTIDYRRKWIGISSGWSGEYRDGQVLPMIVSKRFPRLVLVKGDVNGKEVLIELDTGKSRTVVDSELVEELNLTEGKRGVGPIRITLGDITLDVDNAKQKSFKGISEDLDMPIGLGIGSDLLNKFLFTVDYRANVVVLSSPNVKGN